MKCIFVVILHCGLFVMDAGSFLVKSTPKPAYEALNSQILKLKITQDQLQSQINQELSKITQRQMQSQIDQLKVVSPTSSSSPTAMKIAFQASEIKVNDSYLVDEILKFDRLEMNIGNAYNQNSGKFLVPVTGTYIFWTNVMSSISHKAYNVFRAVLKTEEHGEIARGYTGGGHDYGTATITHMAQLNKGDNVWVTLYVGDNHAGIIDGNGYTYFGGLFLYS